MIMTDQKGLRQSKVIKLLRKVCLLLSLFLVMGCQSTPVPLPEADEPTPISERSEESAPLEEIPEMDLSQEIKASKPWRIAFVVKDRDYGNQGELQTYWLRAWEGAEQAGANFGVEVKLGAVSQPCATYAECVEPQIQLIAQLIEEGETDGMVVAPMDSNRLAAVVDKAIESGIPTVVMDTPLNSEQLLTFVVFNNFKAGQVMGEWVVETLAGSGNALILEGPEYQQNAIDRRNGFLAGLQSGEINVLDTQPANWEVEPAKEITEKWLQEFSQIDVILAANDDMALGAAAAINEANRQNIIVTGFDAVEVALQAVAKVELAATIDQLPSEQARLAIQLLLRHLEQDETFPSIVLIPEISLISKENVEDFLPNE